MALTFGANTSDRVDFGTGTSIDGFTANTFLSWFFPTTISANKRFATKETSAAGFEKEWTLRSTGQIDSLYNFSGADATARSANSAGNILTVNKWWFVAMTLDQFFGPRLYLGDLSTSAYETAYAAQTSGTGTIADDSTANFVLGNGTGTVTFAPIGRIAWFSYHNAQLSLAEIRLQQFRPHVVASTKLFCHLGFNGTGTQPDWSGNGNAGTVTGATVSAHVPLGPLYGFDTEWLGAFTPGAAPAPARPKRSHFLIMFPV